MSGLALPPAQPPADDVDAMLERLQTARTYRDDAARQLALLRAALVDPAEDVSPPERLAYLAIEVDLAERRLVRWGAHIERLSTRARAMGIEP